MIIVIADDLTGAAEIGGLGLRYGLHAEIFTNPGAKFFKINPGTELLVISTDTRSMPEETALKIARMVSESVRKVNSAIIFIKVDSVLRGYIVPELKLHMEVLQYKRTLLVPANPALGRTLTSGQYFVNGVLVHKTAFAHDPEFAVTGACPHEMLRVGEREITTIALTDKLPEKGIIIGETITEEDLLTWVTKAGGHTLLAGGAGFFEALLKWKGFKKNKHFAKETTTAPALFVCGSTHSRSRSKIRKIKENGGPVSYMPFDIMGCATDKGFENWAEEIMSLLMKNKKAIIAIDEVLANLYNIPAARLREKKAAVVELVSRKTNIEELLIEGGSTAASIINRLNFDRLVPVCELGAGVIKMNVENTGLFLTLKPGSYEWPEQTWKF